MERRGEAQHQSRRIETERLRFHRRRRNRGLVRSGLRGLHGAQLRAEAANGPRARGHHAGARQKSMADPHPCDLRPDDLPNPRRVRADLAYRARWAIDHAETITPRNIARIKAMGGGIAVQDRMAFAGEFFAERYGPEAVTSAPPIRQMLQAGIPVGAGTDAMRIASYNPWISLYSQDRIGLDRDGRRRGVFRRSIHDVLPRAAAACNPDVVTGCGVRRLSAVADDRRRCRRARLRLGPIGSRASR